MWIYIYVDIGETFRTGAKAAIRKSTDLAPTNSATFGQITEPPRGLRFLI